VRRAGGPASRRRSASTRRATCNRRDRSTRTSARPVSCRGVRKTPRRGSNSRRPDERFPPRCRADQDATRRRCGCPVALSATADLVEIEPHRIHLDPLGTGGFGGPGGCRSWSVCRPRPESRTPGRSQDKCQFLHMNDSREPCPMEGRARGVGGWGPPGRRSPPAATLSCPARPRQAPPRLAVATSPFRYMRGIRYERTVSGRWHFFSKLFSPSLSARPPETPPEGWKRRGAPRRRWQNLRRTTSTLSWHARRADVLPL